MQEAEVDINSASENSQGAEVTGAVGSTADVQTQPTEIAASIVRSSLARIESTATTMLNRIEAYKGSGPAEYRQPNADRQQPQEMSAHTVAFKDVGLPKKTVREIMHILEDVIATLTAEDEPECSLPILDEASKLAVLQHSIVAFATSFSRLELFRLASRLTGEASEWLGKLFKLSSFQTAFYRNDMECTLHVLRHALLHFQHNQRVDAASAQADSNSLDAIMSGFTVYVADKEMLLAVQNVCRYMGWSKSCVRYIVRPTAQQSSDGAVGRMELELLEAMVESDIADGCRPLIVIGTVGSPATGLTDDVDKLIAFCASRRIWLHLQGLGLASLALTKTGMAKQPNSMTLSLNTWLGVVGVPSVLVYRFPRGVSHSECVANIFDTDPILSNRISSLSAWSAVQVLGGEEMQERIFSAFDSCQELCKILHLFEDIRIVSTSMMYESSDAYRTAIINSNDYETLFRHAVPTVLFQFDGHSVESRTRSQQSPVEPVDAEGDGNKGIAKNRSNAQYYDQLNSWFGQNVVHDARRLNVAVVEHEVHGTAIRYNPFVTGYAEVLPRTAAALQSIESSIESHIGILRSTVLHRVHFRELVNMHSVLQLVELPDWAGLGGVQYEPEGWQTLADSIGIDAAMDELNKFNQALVEALQATDGAFSQGESDGLICVRFGMVTRETDVEELLELVIQTARSVQENSKVLDTMTEIVKKGIEAATIDLQREAEEKLRQEGILRQVPLVGRVVNWWMPPSKETGMKGRSLNLTQGVVESTENIYKYHMQMTPQTSNQLPGNKAPPAPLVQKPINTDQPSIGKDSAQHSRNASSSSELSGRGGAGAIPSPPLLIKSRKPILQQQQPPPPMESPQKPTLLRPPSVEPQVSTPQKDEA